MNNLTKIKISYANQFLLLLSMIILFFFPDLLYATGTPPTNPITQVVCNVVAQLTGGIGQAISTVAVIFIGIGLFMGKISWGLALGIAIGMAMLFGAESVVGWIGGGTFACVSAGAVA